MVKYIMDNFIEKKMCVSVLFLKIIYCPVMFYNVCWRNISLKWNSKMLTHHFGTVTVEGWILRRFMLDSPPDQQQLGNVLWWFGCMNGLTGTKGDQR